MNIIELSEKETPKKNRFFNPFVGKEYHKGIKNDIKLLVLGASHYCKYNDIKKGFNCPYWEKCTDLSNKDSSEFNSSCPYNKQKNPNQLLEDSSIEEINTYIEGGENTSYNNFFNFLGDYFNIDYSNINNRNALCDRLAFTNYVQFFTKTNTQEIEKEDLRPFTALIQTIEELKPDIIIAWGCQIKKHFYKIRRQIQDHFTQKIKLIPDKKDCYFWDLEYNNQKIKIINPYHPCDYVPGPRENKGYWSNNLENFRSKMDIIFTPQK